MLFRNFFQAIDLVERQKGHMLRAIDWRDNTWIVCHRYRSSRSPMKCFGEGNDFFPACIKRGKL